jgi:uncharacterized coiled-coil protein SlyX
MTTIKTLINDLVFENINDKYAWGNYGEFKVMIMKENGYINITKLCKSGGKEFFSWKRLDIADKFLDDVSSALQICRAGLLITINSGNTDTLIRGTYSHPYIVQYIASWVSASFAIKTGFIVASYFSREEKERCARLEAEKTDLIQMFKESERKREESERKADEERRKADERYQEMCKRYGFQEEKLDITNEKLSEVKTTLCETKEKLDATEEKLDVTNENLDQVKITLDVTNEKLEHVQEKLGIAKEIVVPKEQNIEYHEMFTLLKRRQFDPESEWEYYAICGQTKYVKTTRTRKMRTDGMVEVLSFEYTPNTKNILHRVKEQLSESIDYRGNNIDRKTGVNERRLLSLIRDIEKERVEIMD